MPKFALRGDNSVVEHVRFARLQILGIDLLAKMFEIVGMDQSLEIGLALESCFEGFGIDTINHRHFIGIKNWFAGGLVPFPDTQVQHLRQLAAAVIAKIDQGPGFL